VCSQRSLDKSDDRSPNPPDIGKNNGKVLTALARKSFRRLTTPNARTVGSS